jgi:predicted outer membrane repeat protein
VRILTSALLMTLPFLSLPAGAAVVVVDGAGGGDYLTIQEGINAVAPGDTVLVMPGVYSGEGNHDIDCLGKVITVTSAPARDAVIIDCWLSHRGFVFESGETGATVVRGFNITYAYDGGIVCHASSPTIQSCSFEHCLAASGAGIDVDGAGSPQIIGCTFLENTAFSGGGGLRCSGSLSRPYIKGCLFKDNSAQFGGGIMSRDGACPTVEHTVFEGNEATYSGGMRFEAGSATVTQCLFRGNEATSGGAMGSGCYSTPTLRYVTCIDNTALQRGACFANGTYADIQYCTFVSGGSPNGGGMFCGEPFGTMELRNSIIAFSSEGAAVTCDDIGWPTVTHCCVFGNAGGDAMCGNTFGNLYEDPLFCNLPGGDLTLQEDSPCLPANNAWGEPIGALDQGCAGPVSVEEISWGAIKSMYR